MKKIIGRGAEAVINLEKNEVTKTRLPKSYRLPELDKRIIKQRTKAETKIMMKASEIISVPKPEEQKKENEIVMPFVDGEKLSEYLDSYTQEKQEKIMLQIGKSIAKLHKEGIIHGDLTTSNMIYVDKNLSNNSSSGKVMGGAEQVRGREKLKNSFSSELGSKSAGGRSKEIGEVFFIDFGLAFQNGKYEDKGVDIHLLKQALEAKHFKKWEVLFKKFKEGYTSIEPKEAQKVFEKMDAIEKRGRYRH